MNGEKYLATIFQHMVNTQHKTKTTVSEKPVSRTKDEVIKEAKRIEEACLFSAKRHFISAKFWGGLNSWLGIPAVLLSGVVGVSVFSDFDKTHTLSKLSSILVAGLTSLMTFLNPNQKSSAHQDSGNSYDALLNKARIFWSIDCWEEKSTEVLTGRLKGISEEKDRLNKTSPQTIGFSYFLAKKAIERGEASYSVDNQDVPAD